MNKKPSWSLFLSHQYRATSLNLFFYKLFADVANVQFEIDRGELATNVTRLERKIRAADAFVGIYPFSEIDPTPEKLRKESRYFRLELDLAIRSRKPTLIFFDSRYKNLFGGPGRNSVPFDPEETIGVDEPPSADLFRDVIRTFVDDVIACKAYEIRRQYRYGQVGLILPELYTPAMTGRIRELLAENNYTDVAEERPLLRLDLLRELRRFEFVVTDIAQPITAPIASYLHGQFVPTMRLRYQSSPGQTSHAEETMYGSSEVGYVKDIVRWNTAEELASAVQARLTSLDAPHQRIRTAAEAEEYFREASKRKEIVFLSYSGRDVEVATSIAAALERRFANVFNYRDEGKSITGGKPWLPQIFDSLARSAVAIPLLSSSYFASGNCLHEAEEIVARHDEKKLILMPVKLYDQPLEMPSWMSNVQYLRNWTITDPDVLVDRIVEAVKST
jgi:hypothetical protein